MNFGVLALKQNIKTKQNYATLILRALSFILKPKIFTEILLAMLKNGLTHLTMTKMIKDRGLFKDELGGKIMKEFARLRAKIWAYLILNG